MRVILFSPIFAERVGFGWKKQTIRRKARCKPGDTLSLRGWKGLPRRRGSVQVEIKKTVCESVTPVTLGHGQYCEGIRAAGVELSEPARDELARADGFQTVDGMLAWFNNRYGLPFEGEIIRWR